MDVIQLAQTFTSFKKKVWDFARIDVLKFVGLPAAAYAIFQKKSKCSIGMITEPSMLALVMGGIRGGLSFIGSKRVIDSCPTHNPGSQTIYIDANNLVSHTQSKNH